MEFIKKIATSKLLFFIVITLIIISLNLTSLMYYIGSSPKGRTYGMIHNNVQDFYFYLSLMNQGANGNWLIYDPYTTEDHKPSIIFAYFTVLGKIGKILQLPHAYTYNLIRILAGISLFAAAYFLLNKLKIPYPKIAFFFFVFAAPLLHLVNDVQTIRTVPYMNWWTGMDAIRRAAYLPHHAIGGTLLVLSIVFLVHFAAKPTTKQFLLLIAFALLMTFFHTPSLLIILLILPPAVIIYSIRELFITIFKSKFSIYNFDFVSFLKTKISNYRLVLVYWAVGILSLLIMVFQTTRGFPWSQYLDWEKNLQFPLMREYFGALGILLPFALIGLTVSIVSKKFERILISCWFLVPILLIPFAKQLSMSNIRLIQGVPYLPLSILAVIGIETIIFLLEKIAHPEKFSISNFQFSIHVKRFHLNSNFKLKIINSAVFGFVLIIFIIYTYPTLVWGIKDQLQEYKPIFGNVYLDNRLNNVFKYINDVYSSKTTTLTTFYAGNYLPVYTNTISYIGHFGYTFNVKEKEELTQKFFQSKMSIQEAKDFILNNKIILVFQGPEEKPIYPQYLYPEILKVVYDKPEATLYTLKN